MSTQLARHESGLTLTRFYGGKDRGVCLQITGFNYSDPGHHHWLSLTHDEAIWLCGKIITKFFGDEEPDEEE